MDIFFYHIWIYFKYFLHYLIAVTIFEKRVVCYNTKKIIYYALGARGYHYFLYLNIGMQFYREAYIAIVVKLKRALDFHVEVIIAGEKRVEKRIYFRARVISTWNMSTSENEKTRSRGGGGGSEEDNEHGGEWKWKWVVARVDWQRKMSAARIDDHGG